MERVTTRSIGKRWIRLWRVAVLLFQLHFVHAQQCDPRCVTQECDDAGSCICLRPDPDAAAAGDRSFLGGQFCDTPATMCEGTDSFWCENGGTCNELVQGLNYTCDCEPGYTGVRCEKKGIVCGDSFCFNGGVCIGIQSTSCDCPLEYRGAPDCSLPTLPDAPPASAPTVTNEVEEGGTEEWFRPLAILIATIAVILSLVGLALLWWKKRSEQISRTRFQQLRQVQMTDGADFFDDTDDDPFADTPKSQRHKLGLQTY